MLTAWKITRLAKRPSNVVQLGCPNCTEAFQRCEHENSKKPGNSNNNRENATEANECWEKQRHAITLWRFCSRQLASRPRRTGTGSDAFTREHAAAGSSDACTRDGRERSRASTTPYWTFATGGIVLTRRRLRPLLRRRDTVHRACADIIHASTRCIRATHTCKRPSERTEWRRGWSRLARGCFDSRAPLVRSTPLPFTDLRGWRYTHRVSAVIRAVIDEQVARKGCGILRRKLRCLASSSYPWNAAYTEFGCFCTMRGRKAKICKCRGSGLPDGSKRTRLMKGWCFFGVVLGAKKEWKI